MPGNTVIIVDFGSQVTQLIARRVREQGVYSEILSCEAPFEEMRKKAPQAVILSGGPASVGEENAPKLDPRIFELNVPVLGICYGMQLLAEHFKGKLDQSTTREYGPSLFTPKTSSPLFAGIPLSAETVWMSHGDRVVEVPKGFLVLGSTETLPIAAMGDPERNIYAVQFHPEVHHTVHGTEILRNFLFSIAKLSPTWNMASFVEDEVANLRKKIGDKHVVCALSGGIDSTVVACLLNRAIGDHLHCIFVNNGLLRQNEAEEVSSFLKNDVGLNLTLVNAQDFFLDRLKGVEDPEKKRKIIGHAFIEIFDSEAKKLPHVDFLAQGTLYPDVIESVSFKGPSAVIKSHHNVGGLPEHMNLKLVEPLRELFKDEVRNVARELGLPHHIIHRQPFPGPGLAIRVLGEVSESRLSILRHADSIVQEEMRASGYYEKVWQGFAVLLPLRTVGVMGDGRTYENVVAVRVVESVDAMTADWARLPYDLIAKISSRIINEVQGVNRVVYDVSSKPPSTIEWE